VALEATMTATAAAPFRVIEWKEFRKNTLEGFLSLQLPSGLILHNCSLHRKGDSRWVGLPARAYEKSDGGKNWEPLVEFTSKESRDRFQAAAITAVDEYLKGGAQ
jgi:hypothetical protein